jgi:pyruvate dehydrogenase E1 component alpha subunit
MAEWEARDPIPRLAERIIAGGTATKAELDAIDQETIREVEDAVAFAKESPSPKPEDVASYLFAS